MIVLRLSVKCSIPNWELCIETNRIDQVYRLLDWLPGFSLTSSFHEQQDLFIIRILYDESNCLWNCEFKKMTFQTADSVQVLFFVIDCIEMYTENMTFEFLLLHGAVIQKNDDMIALVAPTHMGKSTLATYLVNNGFTYLADDYIFYDWHSKTIYPFPLPISLREGNPFKRSNENSISGYHPIRQERITLYRPHQINTRPVTISKLNVVELVRVEHKHKELIFLPKNDLYKTMLFHLKKETDIRYAISIMPQALCVTRGFRMYYNHVSQTSSLFESIEEGDISVK